MPGRGVPFGKLRTGLAHVGPRGRALVDKRRYLPEGWTRDPARCAAAGVPEAQRLLEERQTVAERG